MRTILALVAALGAAACSGPALPLPPPPVPLSLELVPGLVEGPRIQVVEDREHGITAEELTGFPVRHVQAPNLPRTTLVTLGAVHASRTDADSRTTNLGLVFRVFSPTGVPFFGEHPGALLEVDGRPYGTHPQPGSLLYRKDVMGAGVLETVVVPVDRDALEALIQARSVRGRLGDWLTFSLSRQEREHLRPLLERLPPPEDPAPRPPPRRSPGRVAVAGP